jgi:dolichyl-phosphate beta-glucosyltransferase
LVPFPRLREYSKDDRAQLEKTGKIQMQHAKLSVIIPAYQEEERIVDTIKSLSIYLENKYPGSEIIVVCDGCTDNTATKAREAFVASKCTLKIIELAKNAGKGYAIKIGVKEAQGDYIIFTDADLSFPPNTMEKFLPRLIAGADIVIAQRKKTASYLNPERRILAHCSRFFVGNFLLPGIGDSQAGYKAFSRTVAKKIFPRARTNRFLFDLEILLIAKRENYVIEKVNTDWVDKPGSKVRPVLDSLRALCDLFIIYCFLLPNYPTAHQPDRNNGQ